MSLSPNKVTYKDCFIGVFLSLKDVKKYKNIESGAAYDNLKTPAVICFVILLGPNKPLNSCFRRVQTSLSK
jgi:hypothetical protein